MSRRPARNVRPAATLPAHLPPLNLNAAGIDIGATSHFVAIPAGRDTVTVREFATFTADLHRLADWLEQCGVDTVVMESTSRMLVAASLTCSIASGSSNSIPTACSVARFDQMTRLSCCAAICASVQC